MTSGFRNPYEYPVSRAVTLPLASANGLRRLAVGFKNPPDIALPVSPATAVCYLPPAQQNRPLVILAHGVGDTSAIPCHLLAKALARTGIAGLVLHLPIHSRRLNPEFKKRFYKLTREEWFELYRVSVINIRQALDWAVGRPELDPERIGISGVSFGGYIAAIALGLDSRLKAGAILLSAGNLGKLAWSRSSRRFGKWDVTEEVFNEQQVEYFKYVDLVSNRGFEWIPPPHPGYPFDPYTFAAAIRNKPTLFVNALWDEYFPREAAREFGKAAGCPEQLWLPTGHATAWLFILLSATALSTCFSAR
ncbi:hypothetical protein DD509_04395 [Dehalogenimonas alkenigignens]|nr:hypothetical protein DD509_04395 [Dehalogenimonas alkenigignens]